MLPTIRGVIDRRILVNFRVDPEALDGVLPDPFSPQTVDGYGIAGICLIRFRDLRPRGFPAQFGVGSENAAHRIAVEWTEEGERRTGVYVPRRDTNSTFNTLLGGRLFSGVYHHASFETRESDSRYEVEMTSDDGEAYVQVAGDRADALPADSVFDSLSASSRFFEQGSLGHSPTKRGESYDAMELDAFEWEVTPLDVDSVGSSYFENSSEFDDDAVEFDHALLMEDIDHEWHERESVCSAPASN
ncbi:hypothetical protein AUR64_16195 [Haloprofundus marisrubri]|uniref:DUF2071 domain-containing protein n=1 Tax=Haloprofundus marisrubri TaxID=1514971 RepID=A0A0W1R7H1_9EURY|nr:DUF2071 domain-containing protein [Haloprofundus marisrubri]KTG09321.1 hypothetical protein AUR64_16195 [Haloprofundus marisrubri]